MKEDLSTTGQHPLSSFGNNCSHTITGESGDTLAINRFQTGVGFQIHPGKQRLNNKNKCTYSS
jgi:hypothetical protein